MNSFIPPKPPDIDHISTSPAAFVTINDEDSSSSYSMDITNTHVSTVNQFKKNQTGTSNEIKKPKRKHSKRHKPECTIYQNTVDQSVTSHTQSLDNSLPLSLPSFTPLNTNSLPDKTDLVKNLYNENDKGPYVVHVQKKSITTDNEQSISINPILFGKFIQKHSFRGIMPGSIIRIGRNRIKISFSTFKDANSFVNNTIISENGYNAFIPSFCVTKIGVIKVPTDIEDADIISDSVIPNNPIKILKVRRLKIKTFINDSPSWKPSQSVVITFEGQILPEYLYLYYNKINIQVYKYPTIQCYSCCRFGHMKSNCRSKPRCFKCGQNHNGDSCGLDEAEASCLMCSGNHFATNRKCPEYNRQQNIKSLMSERSISYMEANKLEPRILNKSFAEATSSNASYKKTVFAKPKIFKKNNNKGYDESYHKNLLKEFQIPSPENGCALPNNSEDKSLDSFIKPFISILLGLLNKNSPDYVEKIMKNIILNLNHGSEYIQNNPMELSKSSQQED